MECIYGYGICTNKECPACGRKCPVPDDEGICAHEKREEVYYRLTPKGCLVSALINAGVQLDTKTLDDVWNDFTETMTNLGYIQEED